MSRQLPVEEPTAGAVFRDMQIFDRPHALILGAAFLFACSDDNSQLDPNDAGGRPDQGVEDGGVTDSGQPDAGDDAGASDSGVDAGSDAGTPDSGLPIGNPLEGSWSEDHALPGASGVNGAFVRALVRRGDDLYAGGSFTQMSGQDAAGVARWDGTTWHSVGSNGPSMQVHTLSFATNGDLWAGGSGGGGIGIPQPPLAIYDGSSWSPGPGVDGDFPIVEVIFTLSDGSIAIGGRFAGIDGSNSPNLAILTATGWAAWGSAPDDAVHTIIEDDDGRPCIGGKFTSIGGAAAGRVACWSETKGDWEPVAQGLPGDVYTLMGDGPNGQLLAGGAYAFTQDQGNVWRAGIARFDGVAWAPYAGGVQDGSVDIVRTLARTSNGDLVISGCFETVDKFGTPVSALHVARHDGSAWHAYGSGLGVNVGVVGAGIEGGYTLSPDEAGGVFIGGWFSFADGVPSLGVAHLTNGGASALAPAGQSFNGLSGLANGLARGEDGSIYAGGSFLSAGAVEARGVARWDGQSWHPVGDGVDGYLFEIAVQPPRDGAGEVVWAGGDFSAGPSSDRASFLALYDGSTWRSVGGTPDGAAKTFLFHSDGDVYVGGNYEHIGGQALLHIARWDGANWHSVGSGLDGNVTDLVELPGGHIVASGLFRTTGDGRPASRLAVFDGTRWEELGGGLDSYASDLELVGEDLYVGGSFNRAGTIDAAGVARWDGSSWHPLGAGPGNGSSIVSAITSYGDGLFATGTFGGHVAWWDGSAWHTLQGGIDDLGEDLMVVGHDLWVAGGFSQAGGKPSVGVARLNWAD